MATYIMINSKTGEETEQMEFASGGDAKKYAATLGKFWYAKRW